MNQINNELNEREGRARTLITIATYKRSETACFIREKFQKKDIECFLVHFGSVEDKSEYTSVQVDADDVENAFKLMMDITDTYGMKIEEIETPQTLRQIIVPTDFSKGSEYAGQYAVHLAEKLKAEINLLHVFEDPVMEVKMQSSTTYEKYLKGITKEEEQRAKADMLYFMEKIKSYIAEKKIKGVVVNSSIAMGNVVRKMKRVCKTCRPDMIVLGTHGRREGEKSIFAGVVKEFVNDLKIPVFAIPGQYTVEELKMMNILYATDFNESDNNSLFQLLKITEPFKKKITCIHIDTAHNPAKEDRIDELNKLLKKEYEKEDIQCRLIDYSDVYQGIKDFADTNKINLLSFTIHKRGIFELLFMPNLFKKILQESNLPILLFPS